MNFTQGMSDVMKFIITLLLTGFNDIFDFSLVIFHIMC